MPFYKRENDELLVAPNFVIGPGYELHAESQAEHIYPVDGWHWFADLDTAMVALASVNTQAVTMRQARLALHQTGVLANVDATIAQLPEPQRTAAQIEWDYSNAVERNSAFVAQLGPMLGLSETDIDNLFTLAATL